MIPRVALLPGFFSPFTCSIAILGCPGSLGALWRVPQASKDLKIKKGALPISNLAEKA